MNKFGFHLSFQIIVVLALGFYILGMFDKNATSISQLGSVTEFSRVKQWLREPQPPFLMTFCLRVPQATV